MKCGHNDKCPCGSGKKHKRCCIGAPQQIGRSEQNNEIRRAVNSGCSPLIARENGMLDLFTAAVLRQKLVMAALEELPRLLPEFDAGWESTTLLLTNGRGQPSEGLLLALLGDSTETVETDGLEVRAVLAGSKEVAKAISGTSLNSAATLLDSHAMNLFICVIALGGITVQGVTVLRS